MLCMLAYWPAAAAVEVVTGPVPDVVSATTEDENGRARLTLRNKGTSRVHLRPDPAFVPINSDSGSVPASWTRLGTGSGPEHNDSFILQPDETATFDVRAALPQAGIWETAIEASSPEDPVPERVTVSITRSAPPADRLVPDTLLAETLPASIQLGLMTLTTGVVRNIELPARNSGSEPLRIRGASVGRVSVYSGETERSAATTEPFQTSSGNCVPTLGAQQDCSLTLTAPVGLSPGRYVAEVILTGEGGGQSARLQTVEVRASPWWAGGLAGLGALAGAAVTRWRQSGRQQVGTRILLAERRRQAAALEKVATHPAARAAVRRLLEWLGDLDATVRRGSTTPDFVPYDEYFQAMTASLEALTAAERVPGSLAAPLAKARDTLVASLQQEALAPRSDSTAAISTQAAGLRHAVSATEAMMQRAREADTTLAAARSLRGLPGTPELDTAVVDLAAARGNLFKRLGADETAEQRAAGFDDLTVTSAEALRLALVSLPDRLIARTGELLATSPEDAALKKARSDAETMIAGWESLSADQRFLKAKAYAELHVGAFALIHEAAPEVAAEAVGVPALVPAGSGLIVDFRGLVGPSRLATLEELEGYRRRWNFWTNVLVIMGIGATAVLVLWADNPTWGTPVDLVTALLAGMGTQLAVGSITQ